MCCISLDRIQGHFSMPCPTFNNMSVIRIGYLLYLTCIVFTINIVCFLALRLSFSCLAFFKILGHFFRLYLSMSCIVGKVTEPTIFVSKRGGWFLFGHICYPSRRVKIEHLLKNWDIEASVNLFLVRQQTFFTIRSP